MTSPQYSFKIASGLDPLALVNVETLSAGGRFFYAPVLDADTVLLQPGDDGLPFARGYRSFVWRSDVWRAQYAYLYTTLLGGSRWGRVVISTLTLEGDTTYTTWRGVLTLPDFSGFQRNYSLYQNMPWTFTRCLQVT